MKNFKLILLLITFYLISTNLYSQQIRQFKVQEIITLFDKTQPQVYKFLASKFYSYKNKDSGFDVFENKTSLGTFTISVIFKNGRIDAISTQEYIATSNAISSDLYTNDFKTYKLFNMNNAEKVKYEDHIIPFEGCFYGLINFEKKILATYIISPYNTNIISLNYGRPTKKDYEEFEKEKRIAIEEKSSLKTLSLKNKNLDSIKEKAINPIVEKVNAESNTSVSNKEELIANLNQYTILNPTQLFYYTMDGKKIVEIAKGEKIYCSEKIIFPDKKKKGDSSLGSVISGNNSEQKPFVSCLYFDDLNESHTGFVLKKDIQNNQ